MAARDYKFAMYCWQDQLGDDNALANIFVNGTEVATGVEITATSEASMQCVTFELLGLDPGGPWIDGTLTADIKIVLTNEAYVDADNDRNIWINGLFQVNKDPADATYKFLSQANTDAGNIDASYYEEATDALIENQTAFWNKMAHYPSNVQGSQISTDWWAGEVSEAWTHIPVWGDDTNIGTTITLPLKF